MPELTTGPIDWDEASLEKARRRQNLPRDIGLAIAPIGAAYGAAAKLPIASQSAKEIAKQLEIAKALRTLQKTSEYLPENIFIP